ncbi:transmembrane protein 14C-like protein [Pilobolus umbonatus]|nr:transmembrane protein 14C-like protein [Pilobolus umbonatus]
MFIFQAGSKISLMAGLISGLLALWGSYRVSNNPKDVYLLLAVSSLLLGVMGPRFYRGRKMMPAGLVTLMSIIMIIYYGSRLL